MNNLKDVYLDQLQDLCSANRQAREVTTELAKVAKSEDLRRALERGVDGMEDGCDHLKAMIKAHGEDPHGEHCKGMEGLVREARAHALDKEFSSDTVRDAVIVTQYQRMAHYAIAGYGCAASFATQLGLVDEAKALHKMLEAAHSGNETMTRIATAKINERAA